MERADGKAAGDERLYTCQRIGQADGERAPTPHQTRRAVRVVTGPLHQMWQLTRQECLCLNELRLKDSRLFVALFWPRVLTQIANNSPL